MYCVVQAILQFSQRILLISYEYQEKRSMFVHKDSIQAVCVMANSAPVRTSVIELTLDEGTRLEFQRSCAELNVFSEDYVNVFCVL